MARKSRKKVRFHTLKTRCLWSIATNNDLYSLSSALPNCLRQEVELKRQSIDFLKWLRELFDKYKRDVLTESANYDRYPTSTEVHQQLQFTIQMAKQLADYIITIRNSMDL